MAEKSKRGGFILRVVISLTALGGLIYALRGKLHDALLIIHQGLDWRWFLAAVGLYFVAIGIISWRFQKVLKVQKVKVDYPEAFYLSFLGLFFNLFFPSAMGGDVAKAYFAYQYSGKKLASLTGVVLDRLLGFVTIILIALVALWGYSRSLLTPTVERTLYGALGLLVLGILFFSSRRFAYKFRFLSFLIPSKEWRQNLSDFYHAIREYKNHKQSFFVCLVISFVAQFLFFYDTYLLARSLGIHVSLLTFLVLGPVVVFVSLAPSLSGLGVREVGFVFFFKSCMSVEHAFALSILYDFVFYGTAILAGIVFAFRGGLKRKVIHDLAVAEGLTGG